MSDALPATSLRRRLTRLARSLVRNRDGATIIEFAFALPILGTLGLYGAEMAYMASVSTQISQVALGVADNASRLGQSDNSGIAPTVMEYDVDAVMYGAMHQAAPFDLQQHGRIILSSVEYDKTTRRQFIRWQRCSGNLVRASSYGDDKNRNGLNGPVLPDIGVTAMQGQAVMHVEVFYRHQPLLPGLFVGEDEVEFRQEAVYVVRDDRDLAGGLSGTKTSAC